MLGAGSVTRLNLRLVKVFETFGVIRCAITPYGPDHQLQNSMTLLAMY